MKTPKRPDDPGYMRGWNNAGRIIKEARKRERKESKGTEEAGKAGNSD